MTLPVSDPLESILKLCAEKAPKPWYPKLFCQENAVSRDSLDPVLERLRLGGMIQLTEWMEGSGQGYALTPAGQRALESPRDLDRLRGDKPIIPNGAARPVTRPREGDATTFERGEAVREALLSRSTPVMGRLILVANVLVFLYGFYLAQQRGLDASVYMHWNPVGAIAAKDLEKYSEIQRDEGALSGIDYPNSRWWWGRLLACCFVHIGVTHLFMNMFFLYRSGGFIEQMWGRWRFLVIYLLAGLGGSCLAMVDNPRPQLAGASGALCGIFAAEGAWLVLNRRFMPPTLVAEWGRNLGINVMLIVFISFLPGISGAAHLGGAVVGLIAAVLLHFQRFGSSTWRWASLAGVILAPLACLFGLNQAIAHRSNWAELIEAVEAHKMDKEIIPSAHSADTEAQTAYENRVAPLRDLNPARRNPVDVEKALTALAQAKAKLSESITQVTGAGPFHSARIEEARQARLASLEAWNKLMDLSEDYIEKGETKEADLDSQLKRIKELEAHWRTFLR